MSEISRRFYDDCLAARRMHPHVEARRSAYRGLIARFGADRVAAHVAQIARALDTLEAEARAVVRQRLGLPQLEARE